MFTIYPHLPIENGPGMKKVSEDFVAVIYNFATTGIYKIQYLISCLTDDVEDKTDHVGNVQSNCSNTTNAMKQILKSWRI